MAKLTEDEFIQFYNFHTRYLQEFNEVYAKAIKNFESFEAGDTLLPHEKITFRDYAVLRDIAKLSPYIPYFDEEMLLQLPAHKVKEAEKIVNFIENKNKSVLKTTTFFPKETYPLLSSQEFSLCLKRFVAIPFPLTEVPQNPRLK